MSRQKCVYFKLIWRVGAGRVPQRASEIAVRSVVRGKNEMN